jgi:polyhydroxybutyrate depolymerase
MLRALATLTALCLAAIPIAFAAPHPSDHCPAGRRGQANTEAKCFAVEHGGLERTFLLYAPARPSTPLPLILLLHGGGGNGSGMEKLTERGFNRMADRDGAVIVYPDGIGKGWNDGRTDLRSKAVTDQVDDIGFLRELPRQVTQIVPINLSKVYAAGISNGGLMSYRLACDAADVFAAVAPVAANISVELAPRCQPVRPIPIAIINGTDDPIMPWAGGAVKVLWMKRGMVLSTQATLDEWLQLNHCEPAHVVGGPLLAQPDDGTSVVQHSAQCARGSEVNLYEVRGGGHTWPNGLPYLGPRIVGPVSHALDANDTIWHFFMAHELPQPPG